jgi:hypothetical protein
MTLSITLDAKSCYAQLCLCCSVTLIVVMLNVVIMSVIVLNVVVLDFVKGLESSGALRSKQILCRQSRPVSFN